ncbi:MAG: hypothetical protein ACYYKD_03300 [Rhodospirillales bacterium]
MKSFAPLKPLSAAALLFLLGAGDAHAYIDPASGSMILQAIVAVLAGGMAAFAVFRHKVMNFFKRGDENKPGEEDKPEA